MKYLILALAFLKVQSVAAQDIDSTLVVETEEVVEFQKQSLLKEFQIPYEQDVDRKRLIRLGIQSEVAFPGSSSRLFIDFHHKLGMEPIYTKLNFGLTKRGK